MSPPERRPVTEPQQATVLTPWSPTEGCQQAVERSCVPREMQELCSQEGPAWVGPTCSGPGVCKPPQASTSLLDLSSLVQMGRGTSWAPTHGTATFDASSALSWGRNVPVPLACTSQGAPLTAKIAFKCQLCAGSHEPQGHLVKSSHEPTDVDAVVMCSRDTDSLLRTPEFNPALSPESLGNLLDGGGDLKT